MKCGSCNAENPASSRFCSQCGAQLKEAARCEACGKSLPGGELFCPGCGYHLRRAGTILASEVFEREFYDSARLAFYGRFVERTERKSAEPSLYGVVRLLARRPIELDMAASLGDLAGVVAEAARPYVAALRRRQVLSDLTGALAPLSGEVQRALEKLDKLSRAAAGELIDHRLGHSFGPGGVVASPCVDHLRPGIGTCIGQAVDPGQIGSELETEAQLLLALDEAFEQFAAAYDHLWLPVFLFVERYLADKCHLAWSRLAGFDLDFRRYAARVAQAKTEAAAGRLEDALAEARVARDEAPAEPLAAILEAQLLVLLGRPGEAVDTFEAAGCLGLPFVGLQAERFFWSGRCLFAEARYPEAIAAFESLVALPRQRVESRYFLEGEYLLAHAHLLNGDVENGSRRLRGAMDGGFTDVAGLLGDERLAAARRHEELRATLRSSSFLQALSRQAGIHPRGSTYLSSNAAPLRLATAPDSWLALDLEEQVVFFYDASRNGSGRSGLCLTNRRLLWKGASGRAQLVSLSALAAVELGESGLELGGGLVIPEQVFDRLDALHRLLSMIRKVYQG